MEEETMNLLKIATFLDPRFKSKYLKSEEIEDLKEFLRERSNDAEEAVLSVQSSLMTSDASSPAKKHRNLGTFIKDNDDDEDQMPVLSKEQHINNELIKYMTSSKLDFEEEPLSYWRDMHKRYPYLSNLAKRYLCVCATSTASERLFSTSGNIVTPTRTSLKPEKLTFLNKNLD
jgi:hypothetical protein